jgi:hypothetical protein
MEVLPEIYFMQKQNKKVHAFLVQITVQNFLLQLLQTNEQMIKHLH